MNASGAFTNSKTSQVACFQSVVAEGKRIAEKTVGKLYK
jgi:hypothetical protein